MTKNPQRKVACPEGCRMLTRHDRVKVGDLVWTGQIWRPMRFGSGYWSPTLYKPMARAVDAREDAKTRSGRTH